MSSWVNRVAVALISTFTTATAIPQTSQADMTQAQDNTKAFCAAQGNVMRSAAAEKNRFMASGNPVAAAQAIKGLEERYYTDMVGTQPQHKPFGNAGKIRYNISAHGSPVTVEIDCNTMYKQCSRHDKIGGVFNTSGSYAAIHTAVLGIVGGGFENAQTRQNYSNALNGYDPDIAGDTPKLVVQAARNDLMNIHKVPAADLQTSERMCRIKAEELGIFLAR